MCLEENIAQGYLSIEWESQKDLNQISIYMSLYMDSIRISTFHQIDNKPLTRKLLLDVYVNEI
jgi:hypothetical protein